MANKYNTLTGEVLKRRDEKLEYTSHTIDVRHYTRRNEGCAHVDSFGSEFRRRICCKGGRQSRTDLRLILLEQGHFWEVGVWRFTKELLEPLALVLQEA